MKKSVLKPGLGAIVLIVAFLLSASQLKAQLPEGYSSNFHKGMRYGLFKPAGYNPEHKYPLIIYLHGSGDTTSWNLNWYQPPTSTEDPCFVLTPKSNNRNGGWGTSYSEFHSEDMRKTLDLMDSLMKVYKIDENRLYIHGTSMGGFGVFSVLAKEPGKFAGAYAVCGGGDPKQADKIKQTPLWIFHGDADPVVNIRFSRDIYSRMLELKAKEVRMTEYPGVGHESWQNVNEEKTLAKWLLKQKKGVIHKSPEPVKGFKTATGQNGKAALEWAAPGKTDNADNEIWYYKLFRDNMMVAQVDGTETSFSNPAIIDNSPNNFSIVAVNYFFKESAPVKINPAK